MSHGGSFDDLLARLRAGDGAAASEIFDRFAQRLAGLARIRLGERLRRKMDPEEVVQSAYKSFFIRFAEGQFELKTWDSLWALLTVLTVRKCGHRIEFPAGMPRAMNEYESDHAVLSLFENRHRRGLR